MAAYHLLVYGGGNCEIAAAVQQQMEKLYKLRNQYLKIYAKSYILANSCLAMYRRFDSIKNQVETTKSGGVFEYFYDGQESGVERHELKMGQSSDPANFERFLEEGLELINEKEVTLILMGQSYGDGLFVDFFDMPPSYLSYEDFYNIIYRVGKRKETYFHIIFDLSSWHGVYLPYYLSQIPYVSTMFFWHRKSEFDLFPISKWIKRSLCVGEHWYKVLYEEFEGCALDTHAIGWQFCRQQWELYIKDPCATNWKKFYDQYKYLVIPEDRVKIFKQKNISFTQEVHQLDHCQMEYEDVITYFKSNYTELFEQEELVTWLNEMKNCASYYKL